MAAKRNDRKPSRDDDALVGRHDPDRFRQEDEIDRMAREGGKTEWQERTSPAAGDPVSEDERRGLNVLGLNDPRGDGAIEGVSDAPDGAVPLGEPDLRNPPEID